jgi:hypothetical protein
MMHARGARLRQRGYLMASLTGGFVACAPQVLAAKGQARTVSLPRAGPARLRRREAAGRGPASRDARLARLRTRPPAATVR